MNLKLRQSQTQKQILSSVMRQSIEVLLLPLEDLNQAIEHELQENPLLEIDEEKTSQERQRIHDLIRQGLYHSEEPNRFSFNRDGFNGDEEMEEFEGRPISVSVSLAEHLLSQLHLELTDEEELKIGELIIGNLNEDGYLNRDCEEIAVSLGLESAEPVEYILKIIQNFDPLGIGARSFKECLLIQAAVKFQQDEHVLLIKKMINHHLNKIGKKKFIEIARDLRIPLSLVKDLVRKIATLDPRPGRQYGGVISNLYIRPDVTIYQDETKQYQVRINKDEIPVLRISKFYQNLLTNPKRTNDEIKFIREKIYHAANFIRSIEQRHHTIEGIARYIVEHQKDFLDHGVAFLKPMTLREVAHAIDRNESTVSRAVNSKFVETPHGVFPMKFLFSQALESQGGADEEFSSRAIQEEIKALVREEDPHRPLSDQALQNYFHDKGVKIARRTISKYRQRLNILPVHLRRAAAPAA